jgi:hypothetical protein
MRGGGFEEPRGHHGVAHLMIAEQRERERAVTFHLRVDRHARRAVDRFGGDARLGGRLDERRGAFAGHAAHDVHGARGQRACHHGHAGLDDPGLLEGNPGERGAQMLLVIESDRRDGAGHGGNDVGGVKAAAQPHFDDRDFDGRPPEELEGDGRRGLEEGRQDAQRAVRDQAVGQIEHFVGHGVEGRRVHRAVADHEPLGDVGQVRGGVAGGADPCGAQRRVSHRRHRALAVGAGHVQGGEAPLRVAERLAEARDVLEPQLDAEGFERGKPIEQCPVSAWVPPRRRRPAPVPRAAPALLP